MRILALETSSATGSVALLTGGELVCQTELPADSRSAQSLAPTLLKTFSEARWRPQDVQLVAVTQGPGSFTGLRVGAATAKTFAYAVGAELLGVNTLEAIAFQTPPECGEVWTLLDAHRRQLFVARYRLAESAAPHEIDAPAIWEIDAWLEAYVPAQAVTGPGLRRIADRLAPGAAVIEPSRGRPQAAAVGRLASVHYERGRRDDIWSFVPSYYRPSAAQEKLES